MANEHKPSGNVGATAARAEREQRLGQALRDNLRRRKEQARAKAAQAPAPAARPDTDSQEPAGGKRSG